MGLHLISVLIPHLSLGHGACLNIGLFHLPVYFIFSFFVSNRDGSFGGIQIKLGSQARLARTL